MDIDEQKFEKIKTEAEYFYKQVNEVYCPYFKEKISFNSKGLDHIKFKGWNRTRLIEDQYLRLKFLRLAVDIIQDSHTLQEYRETKNFERQKINSRWEQRMLLVRYYGFVAIIKEVRIKVIIKGVEGGKKFFWSICPYWKQRKKYDGTIEKTLCEGDLEMQ